MNANIIKQDSLLSNISNISVKIDHNHKDGSGLFNNYLRSNQNQVEIPIDAIQDNESFNQGSFMDKILFKTKFYPSQQQPENTWVLSSNAPGLSEEQEGESEQIEPQNQSQEQKMQIKQEQKVSEKTIPIESQQNIRLRLLIEKRLKNQTKNIPKNYGKAIISFIEKYQDKVKYVTQKNGVDYEEFIEELKEKKKVINTIADLRSMWMDYKHAKCIRYLSNLFLRKYALNYIFNSRICNYGSHIKYRYRLCEAIKEPFSFKHIKDY